MGWGGGGGGPCHARAAPILYTVSPPCAHTSSASAFVSLVYAVHPVLPVLHPCFTHVRQTLPPDIVDTSCAATCSKAFTVITAPSIIHYDTLQNTVEHSPPPYLPPSTHTPYTLLSAQLSSAQLNPAAPFSPPPPPPPVTKKKKKRYGIPSLQQAPYIGPHLRSTHLSTRPSSHTPLHAACQRGPRSSTSLQTRG